MMSKLSQESPSIQAWHHHVQHDQPGLKLHRQGKSFLRLFGAHQSKAAILHITLPELQRVGVVLNGQNQDLLCRRQDQVSAKSAAFPGDQQSAIEELCEAL